MDKIGDGDDELKEKPTFDNPYYDNPYFTNENLITFDDSDDSSYNPLTKAYTLNGKQYVLVNWSNKEFLLKQTALRTSTLSLYGYNDFIKDQVGHLTILKKYYNPFFEDLDSMYLLNKETVVGEFGFYPGHQALLDFYLSKRKGFIVEPQSKTAVYYTFDEPVGADAEDAEVLTNKKTIRDFCVKVRDPKVYKDRVKFVGIDKEEELVAKNYYDQVHTLVESKAPSPAHGEQWIGILKQLKGYHKSGDANTNSFSIGMDGSRLSFFIYIDGIHKNYLNKSSSVSGFLCLYVTQEGVEILPQKDTFRPQVVWYDTRNTGQQHSAQDKHAIHILFTYLEMHYGVPNIDKVNIDNLSIAPVSKLVMYPQTLGYTLDKDANPILVQLIDNGRLKYSPILSNLASENKLSVFK